MNTKAFGSPDFDATVAALIGTPDAPPVVETAPPVEIMPGLTAERRGPGRPRKSAVMAPADLPVVPPVNLVADLDTLEARLARSLGLPDTDATPDMFVHAVETAHARLVKARASLASWDDELTRREQALLSREAAVQAREARATALTTLAGLTPPTGRPEARTGGWLSRLFGR